MKCYNIQIMLGILLMIFSITVAVLMAIDNKIITNYTDCYDRHENKTNVLVGYDIEDSKTSIGIIGIIPFLFSAGFLLVLIGYAESLTAEVAK